MDNEKKYNDNEVDEKEENISSSQKKTPPSSSHSHSHHHRHSSRKRKKKVNKRLIWTLIIAMFVLLIVLVFAAEKIMPSKSEDNTDTNEAQNEILTVEVVNPEGMIVKDAVMKYISADIFNSNNINVLPSDFLPRGERFDVQIPVSLKLSTKEISALMYKVEIADNEQFENASVSYLDGSSQTYDFEHLYANTNYFYRVTVYSNSKSDSVTGKFKTADTPRILSIDGVSNARDIGNWKTDSGARIKQGLLIRGTEIDGAVESAYHITNDGLVDMLKIYGIKTDMDLRMKEQSHLFSDGFGARVNHFYYDMGMYDYIFTDEGKERIKNVFTDLANPDNYPVYLHCTYGCDRTGTVCYILEALLGVSRNDCLKEYGLSNLYLGNIYPVEERLKTYEGESLKEQTESYLLSCGVSEFQIQSIRDIFLSE